MRPKIPRDDRQFSSDLCGPSLSGTSRGFCDEAGHPVQLTHTAYLNALSQVMARVLAIHHVEHEGIIPRCAHDGLAWPCPTRQAVTW